MRNRGVTPVYLAHLLAWSMPVLAAEDIAAGRLVVPFEHTVHLESAYYLVCHESASTRPAVALFRDWLLEEATREPRTA